MKTKIVDCLYGKYELDFEKMIYRVIWADGKLTSYWTKLELSNYTFDEIKKAYKEHLFDKEMKKLLSEEE